MKDGLPLVSRLNLYIVETPTDIQLSEVLGSMELSYEFGDQGQGVFVLHHYKVQGPIVLYQPEGAIFLRDKKHWGGHR